LRQAGVETTVFERAPTLKPVGAGITLFTNTMRALGRLGVADEVAARGAAASSVKILAADGTTLSELPPDLLEGAVAVHRADLHEVLASAAGDVRLGKECVGVEGTSVRFADGSEESGDLVVGADGLWSSVRSELFGDETPRQDHVAWRGIAAELLVPSGHWSESWGNGARFGLIDIGQGRMYWFATKNGPEDAPNAGKPELLERFGGWHEPIRRTIEVTPGNLILFNAVYDRPPLERWSSGRVTLLGDGAHPTTPGVGQGAGQAIEDAVVLADCLKRLDAIEPALAEYEARRRPRTNLILKLSRRADKAGQLEGAFRCRIRNALIRGMPARVQRRQLEQIVTVDL
jgi:2-polyprenyl-6-methoxyphenol hydroxylase-like FAD-dependent oxidoreductase